MFFFLSKLLWPLLQPIYHVALSIMLAPILNIIKWYKTSIVLGCYGAFILFMFGFLPTGHNMLVYLERQYDRPVLRSNYIPHGVIVLGGAFDENLTKKHGQVMAGSALERMTTFIAMSNRYLEQDTKLVFSGGSASPTQSVEDNVSIDGEFTDTDAAALFLLEQGFDLDRFILEGKSRNTYENVLFSKQLLKPLKGERWIVITSASHMPRVMNVFEKNDWNIVPFPVDYQTNLEYSWAPNLSILNNFYFTQLAIHEWLGNFVYYITDKSASFLP
jgi:uncharacterized SAM-binding protein YcdF (DUF218 family)